MARGPFRCGRESSLSRRGWAGAPAGLQGTADHAPAECRRGRVVSASTALGRQGRGAPSRSRAAVGSGRWRSQRTRPEASRGGTRSCVAEASFTAGPHTGDHQGLQKQTCERGRRSPQPSSLADHGDSCQWGQHGHACPEAPSSGSTAPRPQHRILSPTLCPTEGPANHPSRLRPALCGGNSKATERTT